MADFLLPCLVARGYQKLMELQQENVVFRSQSSDSSVNIKKVKFGKQHPPIQWSILDTLQKKLRFRSRKTSEAKCAGPEYPLLIQHGHSIEHHCVK